jgi:hypothetical protein
MVAKAYVWQIPGWLCAASVIMALAVAAVVYWLMRPTDGSKHS